MWGLVLESDIASPSTQPVTWSSCERSKEKNNDMSNKLSLESSIERREDDKYNSEKNKRQRVETTCTTLSSILERRQRTRCKQLPSLLEHKTLLAKMSEGNRNKTCAAETTNELCGEPCYYNKNGIRQPANNSYTTEREGGRREYRKMEDDTRLPTSLEKWEKEAICLYRSIQQRIELFNKTKSSCTREENDQDSNAYNNNDNNSPKTRESTQWQSVPSPLFFTSDMLLFQFTELQTLANNKEKSINASETSSDEHISECNIKNRSNHCLESSMSSDNNMHFEHKRPYLLQFYLQMQMLNSCTNNCNKESNNNNSDVFLCAETIASWFVQNHYLQSLYSSQCTKLTKPRSAVAQKNMAINKTMSQPAIDCTRTHAIPRELLGDVVFTLLLTGKITNCNILAEWLVLFVIHVIDALSSTCTWPSSVHDASKWALVDDVRHVVYLVEKSCVAKQVIEEQEEKQEEEIESNKTKVNNVDISYIMTSFNKQKATNSLIDNNCTQENLLSTSIKLASGQELPLAVFSRSLTHALMYMTNYVEHYYNISKTQEQQQQQQQEEELSLLEENKELYKKEEKVEEYKKQLEIQLHKCECLLCLCFLIKEDTRFACHEILNGSDISHELQSQSDIIRQFLYTRQIAMSKVIELMAQSHENNYLLILYALFEQILE